ncbi:hypothetical protein BC826DRAFT_1179196 [Russula brevipes]|nr:hypothetical protein BC826DRAFT_1179196 [Russula brevipes]
MFIGRNSPSPHPRSPSYNRRDDRRNSPTRYPDILLTLHELHGFPITAATLRVRLRGFVVPTDLISAIPRRTYPSVVLGAFLVVIAACSNIARALDSEESGPFWRLNGLFPKEAPPQVLDSGPLHSGLLRLGRPLSWPVGLMRGLDRTRLQCLNYLSLVIAPETARVLQRQVRRDKGVARTLHASNLAFTRLGWPSCSAGAGPAPPYVTRMDIIYCVPAGPRLASRGSRGSGFSAAATATVASAVVGASRWHSPPHPPHSLISEEPGSGEGDDDASNGDSDSFFARNLEEIALPAMPTVQLNQPKVDRIRLRASMHATIPVQQLVMVPECVLARPEVDLELLRKQQSLNVLSALRLLL